MNKPGDNRDLQTELSALEQNEENIRYAALIPTSMGYLLGREVKKRIINNRIKEHNHAFRQTQNDLGLSRPKEFEGNDRESSSQDAYQILLASFHDLMEEKQIIKEITANGIYTLPGGRMNPEDGGDPVETIKREIKEEFRMSVVNADLVDIFHTEDDLDPQKNWYHAIYLAQVKDLFLSFDPEAKSRQEERSEKYTMRGIGFLNTDFDPSNHHFCMYYQDHVVKIYQRIFDVIENVRKAPKIQQIMGVYGDKRQEFACKLSVNKELIEAWFRQRVKMSRGKDNPERIPPLDFRLPNYRINSDGRASEIFSDISSMSDLPPAPPSTNPPRSPREEMDSFIGFREAFEQELDLVVFGRDSASEQNVLDFLLPKYPTPKSE